MNLSEAGLPEDVTTSPHLEGITDVEGLARGFIAARDWKGSLPDELKTHKSLEAIQDVPGLVKSFVNAQELVGKKGIIVPGENATTSDWDAFYNALGRPESADGYEIGKPENLPEGYPYQEELQKGFLAAAHKIGLSKAHAKEMFDWYMGQEAGLYSQIREKVAKEEEALVSGLKKEYGLAFDEKVALGQRAARAFASPEDLKKLEGVIGSTSLTKLFVTIGEKMGEDKLAGLGSPAGGALTPQQAKEEIAKIMSDRQNAYFVADHPDHKTMMEKVAGLYRQAYP